jgi:membrane protease YdiL (CAAX protease family)
MVPTPTLPTPILELTIWAFLGAMIAAWCWVILQLVKGRSLLPPSPLRIVPWRGTEAFSVFCFYLLLQVFAPGLVRAMLAKSGLEGKLGSAGLLLVQFGIYTAFLALAWCFLVSKASATPADLGLRTNQAGREVARGLVGGLILVPVAFALNYAAQKIWKPVPHDLVKVIARGQSATTWVLGAFMAVIAAPIVEEFLFRGVLLGALNRRAISEPASDVDPEFAGSSMEIQQATTGSNIGKVSPVGWSLFLSNVAVSLLFAMLHAQFWPTPFPLFFVSLAFGAMFQRTGSLIAPIVMHATLNGVSTLLLMLSIMAGFDVPGGPENPAPTPPPVVEKPSKVTVLNMPRPLRPET